MLWYYSQPNWTNWRGYNSVCVDDNVTGGDRYVAVGSYYVMGDCDKISFYSTNHGGHSKPYYYEYVSDIDGTGYDIECTDDGYIIAGNDDGKFLVLHLEKNLTDTIWKYPDSSTGTAFYEGRDVEVLPDNEGFVATGGATIKFDIEGDTVWTKSYGGQAICLTDDGGYAICGPASMYDKIWMKKLDSNGDIEWTFYDDLQGSVSAYDIIQTDDGGYLIVGSIENNYTNGSDIILVRVDNEGNFIGRKIYDGKNNGYSGYIDCAHSVVLNQDDFIITGYVTQIVKTNPLTFTNDVFFLRQPDEFGLGFEDIDKDTEILINTENTNSFNNFYANTINQQQTNISYTIVDAEYVDISVYNTLGQKVCNIISDYQEPGTYNINWNNSDRNNNELPTGLYFITFRSNNQSCKSISIPIVN